MLAFCLLAVAQSRDIKPLPPLEEWKYRADQKYLQGKWDKDNPELVTFRKQMFAMWLEDKTREVEVDRLFCLYRDKYKASRNVNDLARMLIIESFFLARHHRNRFDLYSAMRSSPGLNTYEYARAAFCVFAKEDNFQIPWEIYGKLSASWPEDPGVMRSIMSGYTWAQKHKKLPAIEILPKLAERCEKLYPQRDEDVIPYSLWAYLCHWGKTKTTSSLEKAVIRGRTMAKHPQLTTGAHKMATRMLAEYEPILKKLKAGKSI